MTHAATRQGRRGLRSGPGGIEAGPAGPPPPPSTHSRTAAHEEHAQPPCYTSSLSSARLLPAQGHNGPPFMTFHRAFLMEIEQSLLTVSPTLKALPYWDITVRARVARVWDDPRGCGRPNQAARGGVLAAAQPSSRRAVPATPLLPRPTHLQLDNPGTGKYFGTPKAIFSEKYLGRNDGDPRVGAGVTTGAAPLPAAALAALHTLVVTQTYSTAVCRPTQHSTCYNTRCKPLNKTPPPHSLHPQACLPGARCSASSPPSGRNT